MAHTSDSPELPAAPNSPFAPATAQSPDRRLYAEQQAAYVLSLLEAAADRERKLDGEASGPATGQTEADAIRLPDPPVEADLPGGMPADTQVRYPISLIVEELLAICPVPAKVGAFEHVSPPADARGGTPDPVGVLSTLRAMFAEQELRRAGVLSTDQDGRDCLHADLVQPALWCALRDDSGRAFVIVGNSGCLGQAVPVLAVMAHDAKFRKALMATFMVLVVSTIEEMLLLLAQGYAAATAAGLLKLPADLPGEIDDLLAGKVFVQSPDGSQSVTFIDCIGLVGWSIARADAAEPPGFAAVVAELLTWPARFGVDMQLVRVWHPTSQQVRKARSAVRRGQQSDLDDLIEGGMDSAKHLVAAPAPPPQPKPTLSELMETASREAAKSQSLSDAEREIGSKIFHNLIKPLIEQAEAQREVDPVAANLMFATALEWRQVHVDAVMQIYRPSQELTTPAELAKRRNRIRDLLELSKAAVRPIENRMSPSRMGFVAIDVPPSYIRLTQ